VAKKTKTNEDRTQPDASVQPEIPEGGKIVKADEAVQLQAKGWLVVAITKAAKGGKDYTLIPPAKKED